MGHKPYYDLTAEEEQIVKKDEREPYPASVHIAHYQKEWLDKHREEQEAFNLSATIRRMIDKVIRDSDVGLPDKVVTTPDEDDTLVVFMTDD